MNISDLISANDIPAYRPRKCKIMETTLIHTCALPFLFFVGRFVYKNVCFPYWSAIEHRQSTEATI